MASYLKAIQSSYYGFPVFYRIEKRQKNTLVLSYRDPNKNIFELGPHRIDSPQVTAGQSFVEALPASVIAEFFERLLWTGQDMRWKIPKKFRNPKKRLEYLGDCLERRRSLKLPLAVLFAADTWVLFQDPKLHKGTDMIEDDLRAIKRLITHEGTVFWADVTPSMCGHWLSRQSNHMRVAIRRVMIQLFKFQRDNGSSIEDNLLKWIQYTPTSDHEKPTRQSLIRTQISPTMLTDGQCSQILTSIEHLIAENQVSSIDMALLLHLTLAIPLKEICALNMGDFEYLREFPERLTVNITHELQKRKENYTRVAISDSNPYRIRKLPLARFLQEVFTSYTESQSKIGGTPDVPLIPNRANRKRYMRPDDLEKILKQRLSKPSQQGSLSSLKETSNPFNLLGESTTSRMLRHHGVEEEELRFLLGKRPLLVSAKSYADYLNEVELNKLGAIQDRWLEGLLKRALNSKARSNILHEGKGLAFRGDSSYHTQVTIQIELPQITGADILSKLPESLLFEVSSLYGFSGRVQLTSV